MNANLIVRSLDGRTELPIAKTVEYRGRQVVHAYAYVKYQKHSTHSWGVRYPLARWMDGEGIRDLYLWEPKQRVTFHIELAQVRSMGTAGQRDQFGGTLNVPRTEWETVERKLGLAWVPDEHRLVLPWCDEPWPLPERFVPEPKAVRATRPAPAKVAQLDMF